MIRGYHASVAGMLTAVRRMEVVINNLANIQTPGYKGERASSVTFAEQMVVDQAGRQGGLGGLVLSTAAKPPELDLSQGPIHQTGRALDVALEGSGFLVAETANGTVYTRDGTLTRDGDGYLATAKGKRILGATGPIKVADGAVTIATDGAVRVAGELAGRLRLVEFAPNQPLQRLGDNELAPWGDTALGQGRMLARVGDNEFVPRDASVASREASGTTVLQGFIEGSNVDVTGTLTTMLELQRAYQASQRMIRYQDETLMKAVGEIARPIS
jgi:flagellar basal-body rod protein FlgG